MRLMTVDTAEYAIKRATVTQSDYVGTENVYSDAGTVIGQLSPISDKASVDRFGDRIDRMYYLICELSQDIQLNDRVSLTDSDYAVISVMRYKTHVTATLERVNV